MTVAPPITAPDASVTSPVIVPVMVCARLGRLKQTNRREPTAERPHSDRMSCPLGNFGCHARCWLGNKFSAHYEKVNTAESACNDQRSTVMEKDASRPL